MQQQQHRLVSQGCGFIDPQRWSELVTPCSKIIIFVVLDKLTTENGVCPQPAYKVKVSKSEYAGSGSILTWYVHNGPILTIISDTAQPKLRYYVIPRKHCGCNDFRVCQRSGPGLRNPYPSHDKTYCVCLSSEVYESRERQCPIGRSRRRR